MKRLKLTMAMLLLLLCSFCLTACGLHRIIPSKQSETGNDWRTWGIIDAYGVITRDGTDTDVCICLYDASADFYYDQEEQIYYDGVEYPVALPEEQWEYADITFDDLNNDSQSDVQLLFHYEEGSEIYMVWLDEEGGYIFSQELSNIDPVYEPEDYIEKYVGLWEYVGEDMWVNIYMDSTWDLVDYSGDVIYTGTVVASEDSIDLYDDNEDSLTLYWSENGELLDGESGVFVPVDEIVPSAYFDYYDLEINALTDNGTYLLEDGFTAYKSNTDGSGFTRGDVYWEVNTIYDETHDGIREIEFDAICYIPQGVIPQDEAYRFSTSSELYDYYTGMWLTSSSTYGKSDRGENHYVHTIEWNGETFEIEFFYSTEWEPSGNWSNVLYKSYIVYLPENYDGLVFAAQAKPDNYKDDSTRMQLEYVCPEASIMDCVTLDPYANLYFSIS